MKTLLTGIKPTKAPHLGNYVGAIRPTLNQIHSQKSNNYIFVADYHSLTSTHNPQQMKENILSVAATWLTFGLSPQQNRLYCQSDIPELFELYWILSCFTNKGLLNRAHSYKAHLQKNLQEKGGKDPDHGMSMGLFNYPILMAADILLFKADLVPVGKDQLQHLEMTRDILQKFNKCYNTSIFKEPKALIDKDSYYLLGMDGRKMSKSYNNEIPLFCSSEELNKKIQKIQTDSLPADAPKNTEESIPFQIFRAFANKEQATQWEKKLKQGCSHGEMKEGLFSLLDSTLKPYRDQYASYMNQPEKVFKILRDGASKTREEARSRIQEIKKEIGIS